ncbi:hypothetical protein VPH35_019788 [Triticum aestivum]
MPPVDGDESDDDATERLPDLTLYKILTLLPPSSATRCKVVCRRWRSMISSPSFVRDHAAAARSRYPSILLFDGAARFLGRIVDENRTARLALRRWRAEPTEGYGVQNCCGPLACLRNGLGGAELVNCYTHDTPDAWVSGRHINPATGDCFRLGGDNDNFVRDRRTRTGADQLPWYCLGRCPSTGEYKVMRFDIRVPYSSAPHVTCEVCALGDRGGRGLSRMWREVGVWDVSFCPSDGGVHIAGVVYYVANFLGAPFVFGFDLSTYQLRHIDLPAVDDAVASLSELEGQLCASLVPAGQWCGDGGVNMDLWVLPDGGHDQHEWIHRYRFELNGSVRHIPRPLFVRSGRRLIMKCADGSLCSYDVGGGSDDGAFLVFQHKSGQRMSGATADVFVESLLPVRTILKS